jgi:hypothetical protein
MENCSLRRVSAVCAIVGALVTGVSNGMHPELAEPAGIVRNAATSSGWTIVHWGLIIGMVLMQLGYLALAMTLRTSESQNARDWGSLGAHVLTLGLALWISVFAAEAALTPLAETTRAERVGGGALALAGFVDATATAATFVYWLGIALLGGALLMSQRYPRWIGASGVALGTGISLSVGLLKAFSGASSWTERYGFQTLAILFLLWTLVLGLLLWREPFRYAQPRGRE